MIAVEGLFMGRLEEDLLFTGKNKQRRNTGILRCTQDDGKRL
jgi:hypothetical protein